MRKILDRKGDLTNNTLMIIIAVIGLGLLAFGVGKLWGIYANNEEKNAQSVLDAVVAKIDALKDGESNKFVFQGFKGGENWAMFGFSKDQEGRPEKCYFDSCLCVCLQGETCDEIGFCRNLEFNEIGVRYYYADAKRDSHGNVILKGLDGEIEYIPYAYYSIPLIDGFFDLEISVESDLLKIIDYMPGQSLTDDDESIDAREIFRDKFGDNVDEYLWKNAKLG